MRAVRLKTSGIALLALYPLASFGISGALYAVDHRGYDDPCDSSAESLGCFDIDFGYGLYFALGALAATPLVAAGAVLLGLGRRRLQRLGRYTPQVAITREVAFVGLRGRF